MSDAEGGETRRREIAMEHLVFKLIDYVEQRQPGLIDFIGASLPHLGDRAHVLDKDDEAVRDIARRVLEGARRAVADRARDGGE